MPSTTTLSSVPSLTRSLPALTQKEDLKKHPRQGPMGGGENQVRNEKTNKYTDVGTQPKDTPTKYHPASSETLIKTTGQSIHYLRGTPKSILRQTVRDPVQRKTKVCTQTEVPGKTGYKEKYKYVKSWNLQHTPL